MSNSSNITSFAPPGETAAQLFSEKTWLQGALLTSVAYGVEITLFAICFRLLLKQMNRDNFKRTIGFLIYISLMVICGTLFMASMAEMTQLSFIEDRNFPGGPAAYEEDMFSIPVDDLGNVVFTIANWLADGLMLWRCIVVYQVFSISPWITMAIPCLMYAGSLGVGIVFLQQVSAPNSSPWVASGVNLTLPYFALSLALNIVLTILIVLRLLLFRFRISRSLGAAHGSQYTSIAAVIVESAALYSAFSLLFLVPFVVNHPIQNVFIQVLSQIQIIAPLLIIFRVAQGKAWSRDTAGTVLSTSNGAPSREIKLSNMQFSSSGGTRTDGSMISSFPSMGKGVEEV